jgi:DNA polymerase III subunit epsilon
MRRRGRRTPWREGRYLVVDLETTGLDARQAEIISFGAVPVDHGRVQVGAALHGLVRPRHPPPGETVRIHGLREADLATAPPAREALQPLREALHGRVAVAHAAWFDGAFLRRQEGLWRRLFRRRWIDTITLARLLTTLREEPTPKPLTLPALAAWIGVPPGPSHDALGDAFTTSQAFVALATLLDAERPQTVASLLDARAVLRAERKLRAPVEAPQDAPPETPPSEAAPPTA